MNKKKVVLASVLKPVNDTRMFKKIGLSIASTNKYDVNIIGFYANTLETYSNITFHPNFNFSRISFARLLAGFRFYKCLIKIKPQLVIINTHELLLPAVIYKMFHKGKLIYDVQENHFRNLWYTNSFPFLVRHLLAFFVRLKEYLTSPFIDHFFFAEKYYSKEISFAKERFIVLENKCKIERKSTPKKRIIEGNINLIFSGTLAESTGVFGAINLAVSLFQMNENVRLKIVGYTPQKKVLNNIKRAIQNFPFITLIGGNKLVDHSVILSEIANADFGIIYYPTNKSTINSTPTKLYEYLANGLPILLQNHSEWKDICNQCKGAILVDYDNINAQSILDAMATKSFFPNGVGDEFIWQSEHDKLLQYLEYNVI